MCGLVFAVSIQNTEAFIETASKIQNHRGPDSQGVLYETYKSVHLGFGHQRLSIVDLSANGRQPMESASGRMVILFNGEIYNYRELAKSFALTNLRTETDTEVALELIEKLGFEEAISHFNGMWAMVIWDRATGKILLARDRFGKKPLIWTQTADGIYIASEVKAFFALPDFDPTPNAAVSARFLGQMVQNADPQTWVDGVQNLPAATTGEIDPANLHAGVQDIKPYWTPSFTNSKVVQSDVGYFAKLRDMVTDATTLRLHADVPVGIALSGGLDSSILAAIAAKQQKEIGQKTVLFSVVHPGEKDDESMFVNQMSQHLGLGVKKISLDVAEQGAQALFDLILQCNHQNDGPLSSLSSVLFYKLMEQAKHLGISVILTGQGADEVFCGYRKFPALEIKHRLKSGNVLSAAKFLSGFLANGTMLSQFKLAEAKRYFGIKNNSLLGETAQSAFRAEDISDMTDGIAARQWRDIERYSVPYLCHYEDRMSMSWSREVRSPFLDYRVVEMGLQMPTHLKMQRGWTKFALRKAFEDQLPTSITWRKDKKGFVNPEAQWFRTVLRSQVECFMGDTANPVYTHGLVNRTVYMDLFRKFCDGAPNIWFRDIFAPFSLALWLYRWKNPV